MQNMGVYKKYIACRSATRESDPGPDWHAGLLRGNQTLVPISMQVCYEGVRPWSWLAKQPKGAFSLHPTSVLPLIGRSLCLIWRLTLDLRPLFTPNRSAGCAIPDYFGANQWCRTCVSGNDDHSLLITAKESQFASQLFHYRLPLCPVQLCAVSRVNIVAKANKFPFPMILAWDWKRVNVARYSVEDHLIGWWVGRRTHFVSGR